MSNPLRPPLTTAQVIAELRLNEAEITPAARRAAARAAAQFLTFEQREAIAERNSAMYAEAKHKVKITAHMMGNRFRD